MKFKTLLIALALMLVTSFAQAATFALLQNKAGGQIRLTDNVSAQCTTGLVAYSTTPNQPALAGCWTYDAGLVLIEWSDGDVYTYPGPAFEIIEPTTTQDTRL